MPPAGVTTISSLFISSSHLRQLPLWTTQILPDNKTINQKSTCLFRVSAKSTGKQNQQLTKQLSFLQFEATPPTTPPFSFLLYRRTQFQTQQSVQIGIITHFSPVDIGTSPRSHPLGPGLLLIYLLFDRFPVFTYTQHSITAK